MFIRSLGGPKKSSTKSSSGPIINRRPRVANNSANALPLDSRCLAKVIAEYTPMTISTAIGNMWMSLPTGPSAISTDWSRTTIQAAKGRNPIISE